SRAAIAVLLVGTGIAALMGAGFIAAFGTMPHRTGGLVSLRDERRRKAENLQLFEPVGIVALFGVALIAVGLLVGLPGLRQGTGPTKWAPGHLGSSFGSDGLGKRATTR